MDNFFTGTRKTLRTCCRIRCSSSCVTTSPSHCTSKSIRSTTWHARRAPSITKSDPVQTTKTSVHGAINMLGLAKRVKAKVLQASTTEVYGDPQVHPQSEEYWGHVNPIGPRSCYDEGKRWRRPCFSIISGSTDYGSRSHEFQHLWPRMHPNDGRVVSNFIMQALRSEPFTVNGREADTLLLLRG